MIVRGAEDIEVLLLFAIPLKRRVLVKSRGLWKYGDTKAKGKTSGRIIYMTNSGKIMEIIIIVFVLFPLALLLTFLDNRKRKKHLKQVSDAGGRLQGDRIGEVRSPMMLRVGVVFGLVIFWALIPNFSLLMYWDIGIPSDLSVLVPFAVLWVLLLFVTGLAIVFFDVIFTEIQFDAYGVTYRKRFRRHRIHWEEFGKEEKSKNRIIFFDRNGKKLFSITALYEGAKEFLTFYQRKRNFY